MEVGNRIEKYHIPNALRTNAQGCEARATLGYNPQKPYLTFERSEASPASIIPLSPVHGVHKVHTVNLPARTSSISPTISIPPTPPLLPSRLCETIQLALVEG
jgi:hypothetical protein